MEPRRQLRVLADGQKVSLQEDVLLLEVVRALVDEPARVRVSSSESEDGGRRFSVLVPYGDMQHVLGPGRRTIKAIQTLFEAVFAREDRKINIAVRQLNVE